MTLLIDGPLDRLGHLQLLGPVFNLKSLFNGQLLSKDKLSDIVSKFGKAANIVTDEERGMFAKLHDLRRAFGTRWASRVSPADLQRLMRHADIQTTIEYYAKVDRSALDRVRAVTAGIAAEVVGGA